MVRVGFPGGPRLEWYDRSAGPIAKSWDMGAVAPHGSTSRWAYTVPSGRKAFIEVVFLLVQRATAATTAVKPAATVNYTPSGASVAKLIEAAVRGNEVGDKDAEVIGQALIMLAGDAIEGFTIDGSTDGTIDYVTALKLTEFSA